MIAPTNIQRLFPDIVPAPLRTNGESAPSSTEPLSCASIVLISLSGGSWFGTSCIESRNSIGRATSLAECELGGFGSLSLKCDSREPLELFSRQVRFADFADDVENEFVGFLNPGGRIALHDKIDIGKPGYRSAIAS